MSKRIIHKGQWNPARYKKDWRKIYAIMPQYLANGANGCVIYYMDGSREEVTARLVWVLEDLLHYLCTDRQVLQQKAAESLGYRYSRRVPLIVNEQLALVPVRGRKSISKGDGQNGYVVLRYMQNIQSMAEGTQVQFAEGHNVMVRDSVRTVMKNWQLTKELCRCFAVEKL